MFFGSEYNTHTQLNQFVKGPYEKTITSFSYRNGPIKIRY